MSEKAIYRYTNESFSGCDMTASITIKHLDKNTGYARNFTYVLGELQTISYSINMDKAPVRSIGNVNAKDYVAGQRTIAGSIIFNVFNRHFSKDLMNAINENYAGESFLVDEIPPFDVTISAANEYGYRSKLCIFGIRLLNEGQVMSINDIFVENTYQFYATDIDYLDDEMKYAKNKSGMYYLKDNNIKWYEPEETLVKMDGPLEYDNYGYIPDDTINLQVGVKQPAGERANGIADFYITPGIKEGKILIREDEGEVIQIGIRADVVDPNAEPGENPWYANNKESHVNRKLSPGIYTAQVETSDNKKSNKVKFRVNALSQIDKLKKYAPVVKNIQRESFVVLVMEPLHDKVKVIEGSSIGGAFTTHDVINKQVTIEDLKPGTSYTVSSYESKTGLVSPGTKVKTRLEKWDNYKKLGLAIYSNSSTLIYSGNTNRYLEILEKAYDYTNRTGASIMEALMYIREEFIRVYKSIVNSGDIGSVEKANLDVKMTGEIINIQNKITAKERAVIEKASFKAPLIHIDDNCNPVFEFHEDTTFAEFYKVIGNMNYFKQGVDKAAFKEVNGKKNCFKYVGEQGTLNYVEALNKDRRSDKLEFYIMTDEERRDYIQDKTTKDVIHERLLNQYRDEVKRAINEDITLSEEDQALIPRIVRVKEIVDPPLIEKVREGICIKSNLRYMDLTDLNKKYYYCIASLNEVVEKDIIFKIPFGVEDSVKLLDYFSYDLEMDLEYSCWIEDYNFTQISNAISFVFNSDDMSDILREYELRTNFSELYKAGEKYKIGIENNTFINTENATISFLSEVIKRGSTEEEICSILNDIKKLIGIRADERYGLADILIRNGYIKIDAEDDVICSIYYPYKEKIESTLVTKDNNIIKLEAECAVMCCYNTNFMEKGSVFFSKDFSNIRRI